MKTKNLETFVNENQTLLKDFVEKLYDKYKRSPINKWEINKDPRSKVIKWETKEGAQIFTGFFSYGILSVDTFDVQGHQMTSRMYDLELSGNFETDEQNYFGILNQYLGRRR